MTFSKLVPPSNSDIFVDPDFELNIILHIIKSRIKVQKLQRFPIYLAIQGPKGEGKTVQTIETCLSHDITVFYMSGSALSGSHEGESVEVLRETYIQASAFSSRTNNTSVIVIDDFHLSIASLHNNIEMTVNSQLLTGFMMNLGENPKICSEDAIKIPIILIGNDFTKIHSPLTRHGRMNFYEWKPDMESKTRIIENILSPFIWAKDFEKIQKFVEDYNDQPIAFFSELVNDLIDKIITSHIGSNSIRLPSIEKAVNSTLSNTSYKIDFFYKFASDRKSKYGGIYETFN